MRRSGKQLILLIIALCCLSALSGIQITWILKEARMQEQQFNENVKLALVNIEESLSPFLNKNFSEKFYNTCPRVLEGLQQAIDLDSLISNELRSSGIILDYEYGIVNFKLQNYNPSRKERAITANLAEGLKESGYQLKINFPKKSDFIFAQVGYAFITSIILIILAIVSFMLIFTYYRRERDLSLQIRDFVNNMTHEFKTPLTNIAFANNMISKNDKIKYDDKLKSYSKIISAEQNKLNDRVEQLLSTSRAPHIDPGESESLDISLLTEDIIESFAENMNLEKGIISLNKKGDDFMLWCNPAQINIILSNLIDNALKYTRENPKIEISILGQEKAITIEVQDNGVGMSREEQRYIFDNYYRVPTGDKHDIKGFGIGLYHVKTILDKMGGKIKVNSAKNKGSTFTINILKHQNKNG